MATVFPTPVGVFPPPCRPRCSIRGLPHARGGVSTLRRSLQMPPPSSPRPWGCFHHARRCGWLPRVFPTPVGVFLKRLLRCWAGWGLPHARGGVSDGACFAHEEGASSPRPWGCFQGNGRPARLCRVFPTPVGVFPLLWQTPARLTRLPHARGGVSHHRAAPAGLVSSSPRPWGCFRQSR